jgi:uncharacterized protein (DUF486 family)
MAGSIVFFTYEWFAHARGNFDALIMVIAIDLGLAFLPESHTKGSDD